MLLAISALSYAFSAVEYLGYGHVLQRRLHSIRVRSMQIALRNGDLDPKLADFLCKVVGWAILVLLATSMVVTIIVVPIMLIFGKETASGLLSTPASASTLGVLVFGPVALIAAIGAAYVVWCVVIDVLAKCLDWAHQSRQGMVATLSFAIGTASFLLDRLFT